MGRLLRLGMGALLTLGAVSSPARAQDARFESADIFYATNELARGGAAFEAQLFRRGWPTSEAYHRLTHELAQEPADLLLTSFLASGAGLPLSSSAYARARLDDEKRSGGEAKDVEALIRRDLSAFKVLTGFSGRVPPDFDPTFIPYQRGSATLDSPWSDDQIQSWRWSESADSTYALTGLGHAMIAELEFVSQQVAVAPATGGAGAAGRQIGRTQRDGFFALVALSSAVAKAWEVNHLLYDSRDGRIAPRSDTFSLDPLRFHVPHRWTSSIQDGRAVHRVVSGAEDEKSHLGDQAALLLGLSRLAGLTDPESKGPVAQLVSGRGRERLFHPDTHKVAVEAALFVFRCLRSLHIDVVQRQAISVSRGRTVQPKDVGLYLMALARFMSDVRYESRQKDDPLATELQAEQDKARILVSTLGRTLQLWEEADDEGLYDVYSVAGNSRASQERSLATQGLVIRGLLACHRVKAQLAQDPLESADRLFRWLDRRHWDPSSSAYVEWRGGDRAVSLLGAAAMLGALREMALETGDGAYLLRYRQYLESLHEHGFFRSPGELTAPGLALDVTFK